MRERSRCDDTRYRTKMTFYDGVARASGQRLQSRKVLNGVPVLDDQYKNFIYLDSVWSDSSWSF